ncbi:MAG: hypothetical protein WDN24_03055 [Sphingomonas sp.]
MTVHELTERLTAQQPYRFTRRDYVLLSEHGTFDKLAKAELIEGVIVAVNAQYSRHIRAQTILLRCGFADACDRLGGGLGAWVDGSVSIDDHSMPRPDISFRAVCPTTGR